MRCSPKVETRRLLCVLLLRLSAVSVGSGQTGQCKTVTARRFPPLWSIDELEACFVVIDSAGQKLAYVYFEEEPGGFNTTAMSRTRSSVSV